MKQHRSRIQLILISIVLAMFLVSTAQAGTAKININTATEQELCELKRIGPSYAARIVAYRKENGPFTIPGDIMKVKGIGKKTFEANKEIIIVNEEELATNTSQ